MQNAKAAVPRKRKGEQPEQQPVQKVQETSAKAKAKARPKHKTIPAKSFLSGNVIEEAVKQWLSRHPECVLASRKLFQGFIPKMFSPNVACGPLWKP